MSTTTRARRNTKTVAADTDQHQRDAASLLPQVPSQIRGKLRIIAELLARPQGAQVEEMMAATGWQAHSLRGAIAGSLKKKHGLHIVFQRTDDIRVYRIVAEPAA